MNKLLLLGLWMSLSIATVGGIICHKCMYYLEEAGCRDTKKTCVIQNGYCVRETLFLEDRAFYTRMMCLPSCKETVGGTNIYEVRTCCKERNFCNV